MKDILCFIYNGTTCNINFVVIPIYILEIWNKMKKL